MLYTVQSAMPCKYWAAAFFDSRDPEVINVMAANARRMLISQRELQRDELLRLKMKYPHLTTRD
jgi:hypothetical protein